MKNILICTLTCIVFICQGQTFEQKSATKGFSATLGIGTTGWGSETFSNNEFLSGFGVSLEAGYGFNEKISAFLRYELGPSIDSGTPEIANYPSTLTEIGARWHFRSSTKNLRPFFELSGTFYGIDYMIFDEYGFSYNVAASGAFLGVGGGARYFIIPAFSVGAQLHADFGSFSTVTIEGIDLEESHGVYTTRFSLMAAFHFGGL